MGANPVARTSPSSPRQVSPMATGFKPPIRLARAASHPLRRLDEKRSARCISDMTSEFTSSGGSEMGKTLLWLENSAFRLAISFGVAESPQGAKCLCGKSVTLCVWIVCGRCGLRKFMINTERTKKRGSVGSWKSLAATLSGQFVNIKSCKFLTCPRKNSSSNTCTQVSKTRVVQSGQSLPCAAQEAPRAARRYPGTQTQRIGIKLTIRDQASRIGCQDQQWSCTKSCMAR